MEETTAFEPSEPIRIAGLAGSLSDGEVRAVEAGSRRLCVARSGGSVYAFSELCTHAQCSLSDGFLDEGRVVCLWHGSEFDLHTGAAMVPPATDPIEIIPAEAAGDDLLLYLAAPGLSPTPPTDH